MEGVDLDATIDLGKNKNFSKISISFLQDENAWVWMPLEVDFYTSHNGKDFKKVGNTQNTIDEKQSGIIIHDFETKGKHEARYVRVVAKNRGICPSWHKGDGGKSWIFADEIVIE